MLTKSLDVDSFMISKVAKPKLLYNSKIISNKVIVFLHWFRFVTTEIHCHFLDFKMYGIVERRLQPRRKAASYNVSESETKFDLHSDLQLNTFDLYSSQITDKLRKD